VGVLRVNDDSTAIGIAYGLDRRVLRAGDAGLIDRC